MSSTDPHQTDPQLFCTLSSAQTGWLIQITPVGSQGVSGWVLPIDSADYRLEGEKGEWGYGSLPARSPLASCVSPAVMDSLKAAGMTLSLPSCTTPSPLNSLGIRLLLSLRCMVTLVHIIANKLSLNYSILTHHLFPLGSLSNSVDVSIWIYPPYSYFLFHCCCCWHFTCVWCLLCMPFLCISI